jgi:hypothetical protein
MSKKSLDELMSSAKTLFADNSSDEVLSFLEDLTDSYTEQDVTSYEDKISELERKVEDTENEWREKYKARFFEPKEQISVIDEAQTEEGSSEGDGEIEVPSVDEIAESFK